MEDFKPMRVPQINPLICPDQPCHDIFLEIMRKVFYWSRLFGVAGPEKNFWRFWAIFLFILIMSVEAGAIYKLIKTLAGLSAYSIGNRSVTARLAGTMFYTTSFMSLILSSMLSCSWRDISAFWASVEKRLTINVPSDNTLKRRMITITIIMVSLSVLEHAMSVISQVEFDLPSSLLLEQYILTSHAFILIPSDYSLWIGLILLFVSNVATVLWNIKDLLIVLITMGLTSRYHRLNQCVARVSAIDKNETKWCKNTDIQKVYTWRKIREAYVKQAMLVRKVDQSLGYLILLTSFGNFYFICLQLFLGITQGISGALTKRLYYMISLGWICIRFSFVVLSSAEVHVHSKTALRYLHGCNTRCYNVEVERLQKQLAKDFVALSGLGFFYLDRNILLQVAGAVVTYELVLIQFDTKGFADHTSIASLNVTK